MDCTCQASLFMGFSQQEYWSGLPFPTPGHLPNPGPECESPVWQAGSLSLSYLGNTRCMVGLIHGCKTYRSRGLAMLGHHSWWFPIPGLSLPPCILDHQWWWGYWVHLWLPGALTSETEFWASFCAHILVCGLTCRNAPVSGRRIQLQLWHVHPLLLGVWWG